MTRTAAILLLVLFATGIAAHEGLHEQIARITERLARQPRNAALVLERGELHRLHGDWKRASRDYDRAQRIDPGLATVDLCRGLLSLDRGRGADALTPLRRFTKAHSGDSRGRTALARALALSGMPSEAADEYAVALAAMSQPDPDLILEHVRALVDAERPAEALRQLDSTQARLGPLIPLLLAAIDLEVASGRYDDALQRIDTAMAVAVRKETWLERRGHILRQAGRNEEARTAYQAALVALATLPPERRLTRAMQQLEERLHRSLAR